MSNLVKVSAVKAYERNSRTHSDEQIQQIAASIVEFGMVGAIVVRNGVVAKGHGTLAAIRRIYSSGRRIFFAPGEAAGGKEILDGMVPVIDATGWSEEQFKAYVIADNKLGQGSEWNEPMLVSELTDLKALEFPWESMGFSDDEVAHLLDEQPILAEKRERLKPVRYVRMLVSIPVGAEVQEADAFVRAVAAAGGRVDYAGN